VESLADHETAVQHKHEHNRMELEHRALQPQAHGDLCQRPALVHPESHDLHIDQGHGNRCAFEVLGFAGCVLGDHGDGDVEACETGEAAENEEAEQDVIEGCAKTEGEGGGGRTNAEGDLEAGC
jgi:hypothetical protein